MPYTEFTLDKIEERFGIKNRLDTLFANAIPVTPSDRLRADLQEAQHFILRTEKARSEWVVVPVLREIARRNHPFLTIHSGENLDADATNGLNGECDFILAKDANTYSISFPIIQIVEAKKQDFDLGIPQCAAQLIGAEIFNRKREAVIPKIYGCVTTGTNWQFLVYEDSIIYIDPAQYSLGQIDLILGILQQIVDYYKIILA
jgi:hypothetical protein